MWRWGNLKNKVGLGKIDRKVVKGRVAGGIGQGKGAGVEEEEQRPPLETFSRSRRLISN